MLCSDRTGLPHCSLVGASCALRGGPGHGGAACPDPAAALLRAPGGILIKEEELKVAWDFFDTKQSGKLTAADIKRRLTTFYKNVSNKEIKF